MSTETTKKLAPAEALDLICGPRMEFYGPPQENLQDIADTWTPYVKRALETKGSLDATDVTMLMVLLKAIRQVRGYHRDSSVDICGYATLAEVLNDPDSFKTFVHRASKKILEEKERDAFLKKFLPENKEE